MALRQKKDVYSAKEDFLFSRTNSSRRIRTSIEKVPHMYDMSSSPLVGNQVAAVEANPGSAVPKKVGGHFGWQGGGTRK